VTEDQIASSKLLIGKEWVEAEGGRTFVRNDPYTGEAVTRAAAASLSDVQRIVEAAEEGFAAWSATPPRERAAALMAIAQQLVNRSDELAQMALEETGAPLAGGHLMVGMAVENLRWAATQVHALEGRTIPSSKPDRLSFTVREPVGAVLVMAPWNGAIFQIVRSMVMPLALGNSVVLRGSELAPRCHAAVARACLSAGLPAGVVGYLTNDPADAPAAVESLIASQAIQAVSFTGSDRVGSIVASQAGAHFKKVVLELGDTSPVVVLADANVDAAVTAVAIGGFGFSGQGCIATERVLADSAISREFSEKLVAAVAGMKTGDPRDPATQLPPLINEAAVDRVEGLVQDAVEAGATLLCGGTREGRCFPATVLTGVTPSMRIFQEETFGPVVTVTEASGPEDALRLANDSSYGLCSSIFTGDVELGLSLARRVRSGMCHINGMTLDDEAPVPFGGVKRSGTGRHGLEGALDVFSEVKWITVEVPGGPQGALFGVPLG